MTKRKCAGAGESWSHKQGLSQTKQNISRLEAKWEFGQEACLQFNPDDINSNWKCVNKLCPCVSHDDKTPGVKDHKSSLKQI